MRTIPKFYFTEHNGKMYFFRNAKEQIQFRIDTFHKYYSETEEEKAKYISNFKDEAEAAKAFIFELQLDGLNYQEDDRSGYHYSENDY